MIETIIITDLAQNNLKKISFTGDSFRIRLLDLRILFGAYEIAYNYRDNYTGFFFLNSKGKKISKVYSKKNNKIVKEKERFFEYSQKSKLVSSFSEKEIIFNNIIFEVHIC